MNTQIAYIPVGVPTFHLGCAQEQFDKSVALLKSIDDTVKVPDEMLFSTDKLNAYLDTIKPDLAIVQNLTFANSAYISEVLRKFSCPVLLWTLKEPVIDGGKLRLNSLTGAFSAGNTLMMFDRPFEYLLASPDEEKAYRKIKETVSAVRLINAMRELRILQVGHTPQGFGFGRALDADMMRTFGSETISIEARELIDSAKSFTDDEIADYLADANNRINGLSEIDSKNVLDFVRLYKAYAEYIKNNNIGALASRCWPDFFISFGTPVCAVLAMMNDLGVSAACEADTYGALSMYCGQYLTNRPVFFGDPVSLDAEENSVTFWHCGTAACSLARKDTGACAGVHCNRKIGPTLEFGCEAEKEVTVLRIGRNAEGKFRIFVATGEALDKPKQFLGTSIVIKTDNNAEDLINKAVKDGWEPHFAVAMGNIKNEIKVVANFLGLEISEF